MKYNLLDSDAQALVNPVNCVGVMGKGLALEFKKAYPQMYLSYRAACKRGELTPGRAYVWAEPDGKIIVNFTTKDDWRKPSQMVWIQDGLLDLRRQISLCNITSIAIPPLGCGNGGLNWKLVRPMILDLLKGVCIDVWLYQPKPLPRLYFYP